jgi:hypothetical protein
MLIHRALENINFPSKIHAFRNNPKNTIHLKRGAIPRLLWNREGEYPSNIEVF